MPRTRRDVWKLQQPWDDILVWYARGVAEVKKRAIDDPTSWRYLAAMHGFDGQLWQAFGYLTETEELPEQADQDKAWFQCQHQSWYFLPWHRGYLAALERILRAAIVELGGPDDWALPYWNYGDRSNPNALKMPSAFSADTLPDGQPNPLKVTQRYGDGTGKVVIFPRDVPLDALRERDFAGADDGGTPGFGGPDTPFSHSGQTSGLLEDTPHNILHVRIGGFLRGANPNISENNGLMSMPDTAALDPIFWLHHANIDRLWEVWLQRDPRHLNSPEDPWQNGPADRAFVMPDLAGQLEPFTAHDMLNTQAPALDYIYQDVTDPLGGVSRRDRRLEALGVPRGPAIERAREVPMAPPKPAELIGANTASIRLEGATTETSVQFDRGATQELARSFTASPAAEGVAREPDRVFLNLENIRGANDATIFDVYVNLPEGADPSAHPENLAGVVSLFGVAKASDASGARGGNGLTKVLEISNLVDALHIHHALDLERLKVRFVPSTEISPEDKISVGRVSVYRQGQ